MKNTNKKRGFTIVELVIVIAVVAILAAVLIPTFVGLVDKANVSADEQAVKQMNTVLAADGAVEPTDIQEFFNVLYEAGFTAKNYTPLSNGKFFFWDGGINRVLYVDGDYTILNTQDAAGADEKNWISLNGKIQEVDLKTEVAFTDDKKTATVDSAEELVTLANAINDKKSDVKEVTTITLAAGEYNFKGAEFKIASDKAITVGTEEGTATFKGIVNLNPEKANAESNAGVGREYFTGMVPYTTKDITFKNITVENAIVGSKTVSMAAVFVGHVAGGAKVTFDNVKVDNVTVRGLQKVGIFAGQISNGASIEIKDNCSVTNSEVQATVGLAGKIFGNAIVQNGKQATVTVEDVADVAGDTVTVKLVKDIAVDYITVDGVEYGRDMDVTDGVLTPAKDRKGGYKRYFRTVTDYGFVSIDGDDIALKNEETKVQYGYNAIPATVVLASEGATSVTWNYESETAK